MFAQKHTELLVSKYVIRNLYDNTKMAYKGFVWPILEYACPVWDQLGIVVQEELEKIQNRFFPDTIRDWNALPASIITSAECSENPVARFTSHHIFAIIVSGEWMSIDVSPVKYPDSEMFWFEPWKNVLFCLFCFCFLLGHSML